MVELHVLGYQEFISMGNITKIAYLWFQVERKRTADSLRNSYKTVMITATKDPSLRLMLVIPSIYRKYRMISRSFPKE